MKRVMIGLSHGEDDLTKNLIKILRHFSPDIIIWEGHIGKMGKDVHDAEHEAIKYYRRNVRGSGLYLIDNPRRETPFLWDLPERKIPYSELVKAIIEHYKTGILNESVLSELDRGEPMFSADGYMTEREVRILRKHPSEIMLNIGGFMHFADDPKNRTLYSKIKRYGNFERYHLSFHLSFANAL